MQQGLKKKGLRETRLRPKLGVVLGAFTPVSTFAWSESVDELLICCIFH